MYCCCSSSSNQKYYFAPLLIDVLLQDAVFSLFHVWSFWFWLQTSWTRWMNRILCHILLVVYHSIWLSLLWSLLLLVLEEVVYFFLHLIDWKFQSCFLYLQEINTGLDCVNLPVNSYLAFVHVFNCLAIFLTVFTPMEICPHPQRDLLLTPPRQIVKTCQR